MSIYDNLNAEQKRAVFQKDGPILIFAGAGSGKTRVITYRVAYLMQECDVNPWNILAITFTNKAAGEMRERVDKLVGFGSDAVWISTFHSMCTRILRRHIDLLGFDNRFTIYDADDSRNLIRHCMEKCGVGKNMFTDRSMAAAISAAKNQLIYPYNYVEWKSKGFDSDIRIDKTAEVYKEYQAQLQRNNALDFDDLLMKTVELFKLHEEVLSSYQNRFRYIMVDEYQDTNRAQFEIVRLLAAKYRNLCVVGDDDQSIYKFRGADISNILNFEKVYPESLVVKLEQNYRSTGNILAAANAVISKNEHRMDKRLWTNKKEGSRIHVRVLEDGRREAEYIAKDILYQKSRDPALHNSDFAVLYRTNAQSRPLEEEFVKESIPYNIVGGHNFYDRMEIKDILGYLITIDNDRDDINTQRIINVPKRGIGKSTIDRVQSYAEDNGISFFTALSEVERIPDIGRGASKIKSFVELIKELRSFADTGTITDTVKEVIRRIGYEDYLKKYDEETAEDRIENVNELISKAADYEEEMESDGEETPTLSGFLEDVALVADVDQVGESDDKVLLMTLHSAKGLEFDDVYIGGMETDLFPSYQSMRDPEPDSLEEERRLAYVGITRAKKELTLTSVRERMIRGQLWPHKVSMFVEDIPEDLLDWKEDFEDFYSIDDYFEKEAKKDKKSKAESTGKKAAGDEDIPPFAGADTPPWDEGTSPDAEAAPAAGTGKRGIKDTRPKAAFKRPHAGGTKKSYSAGRHGLESLTKGAPTITKPDYQVGDRVHHVKYGDGTVEEMTEGPRDWKVTVDFDDAESGRRIMYAAFAKLQKI